MRRYETVMALHPELPEAQIRETIERTRRLIEGMGGQVDQFQEWGMRELAYPIRKLGRGYFVLAQYSATADVVRELARTLKIAEEVLRFLTVASSTVRRKERPSKARKKREAEPSGGAESPRPAAE